ncbi:hypothetical protein, partial [Salmonella enterica]
MLIANLFMSLDKDHRDALTWFRSQAGEEIGWPTPLGGTHLANKAKGIHKPAGWKYALSIRQSMSGPYEDVITHLSNGAWHIRYAQEGRDRSYFTNQALEACMRDSVPVAVLVQVKAKP